MIMRATLGLTQQDVVYKLHSEALKGLLPRGSYHYYRTNASITEQVKYYYDFAGRLEIAPVMDLEDYYKELPKGQPLIDITERFLDECDQKFQQKTILYTGPNIIKNYMRLPAGHRLTKRPLWIAHYGTKKPQIAPWTDYVLHQYSETVDDQGRDATYYGFNECHALDMNYFNGDEFDFEEFAGGKLTEPVDPDPNPSDEFLLTAKIEMNVRSGPSVRSPRIGTLPQGSTVKPRGVAGSDAWVEIGTDRWVCAKQGDTQYLV